MKKQPKSYEDPYERKIRVKARMEFRQKRENQSYKYKVNDIESDDTRSSRFGISEFNLKG